MRETIVVAGSLAQRPGRGGHAWVFLQYLLGLQRLGFDVVFVDRLEPEMCVDVRGEVCSFEASIGLAYLADVMAEFGLADCWSLLHDGGRQAAGLDRDTLRSRVRSATLVLDIMGYLEDDDLLDQADLTVFLDIDPGFGQMWRELGLHDLFTRHDRYVTIGENIGRPGCRIPTNGIDWVTTRQPVVLEHWPVSPAPAAGAFTSVGAWRGAFAPVDFEGETYGLRVHEFRRFLDLPKDAGGDFEIALDIHDADAADLRAIEDGGWRVRDPREVASTPSDYRRYVQQSRGELLVAKNMYVRSRSGWFSDRSICYLASGRPVIAQDTGLAGLFSLGNGLVTFSSYEEATDAVARVQGDYAAHARAARMVAEDVFDSDTVLRSLLDRVT
jgi:hypothetical protein